jgi:hypothetical protein
MPRVSPRLAAALDARRAVLNAHFRRHGRGVDPEAFGAFMARTVDPVVSNAAGDPALSVRLAEALFELGLRAFQQGRLSAAGESAFETGLRAALPRFGAHLADDPRRLVVASANGWDRLERALGADAADGWLREWASVAEGFSGEALYEAGMVLAWRAGLAEARDAALLRLRAMAPALQTRLVGSAELDPDPERRFATPGSRAPLGALRIVARVGGFAGFGGPFLSRPEVHAVEGRVYATDGDVVRELFADVFGARLSTAQLSALEVLERAEPAGRSRAAPRVDKDGAVQWAGLAERFEALRGASTAVAVPGLLAVTLQSSFCVFVLGRREESRA